jgi:hypothetical protein
MRFRRRTRRFRSALLLGLGGRAITFEGRIDGCQNVIAVSSTRFDPDVTTAEVNEIGYQVSGALFLSEGKLAVKAHSGRPVNDVKRAPDSYGYRAWQAQRAGMT